MKPASTTRSTSRPSSQSPSACVARVPVRRGRPIANTAVSTPAARARSSPRASARLDATPTTSIAVAPVDRVEHRLEVGALARDEDGDPERHGGGAARQPSTG